MGGVATLPPAVGFFSDFARKRFRYTRPLMYSGFTIFTCRGRGSVVGGTAPSSHWFLTDIVLYRTSVLLVTRVREKHNCHNLRASRYLPNQFRDLVYFLSRPMSTLWLLLTGIPGKWYHTTHVSTSERNESIFARSTPYRQVRVCSWQWQGTVNEERRETECLYLGHLLTYNFKAKIQQVLEF